MLEKLQSRTQRAVMLSAFALPAGLVLGMSSFTASVCLAAIAAGLASYNTF